MSTMNFSVREFRHICGRLLHAFRVPGSQVNAVREALLSATASGFPGLDRLEAALPVIGGAQPAVTRDEQGLNAHGASALLAAPTIVDLLLVAQHDGATEVAIRELADADLLPFLAQYAAARGLGLSAAPSGTGAVVALSSVPALPAGATQDPAQNDGAALAAALESGFHTDTERFWRMYHESNNALTPDSEVSRSHAGAQYHDEDGNVIGEIDEEAYLYIKSVQGVQA